MDRKAAVTLTHERDAETTEELVGVLTAISVVSKRLAKRLALLEQRSSGKDGEPHERNKHPAPAD